MNEVFIVTYCTCKSNGSILQAYALSTALSQMGYDNSICIENTQNINKKKLSYRVLLKKIARISVKKKILLAEKKKEYFISKNIPIKHLKDYQAFEKMAEVHPNAVFLAGSDQIWNPKKLNPIFFLSFAHNRKCISYAASMGDTEVPNEKKEQIGKWLHSFRRISVREKACVGSLQELCERELTVNIDPTFLVDVEFWRNIEHPYPIRQPYILLYMLYWDKECKKKIMSLKRRTGLPVYAICPDVSRVYADHYIFDVGIEEFIWLIDHAEYVITSSFHGVALSIQFQKRFATVINKALPSRFENLSETLSIPIVDIDDLDKTTTSWNYDVVSRKILSERKRSLEYLKEAIDG